MLKCYIHYWNYSIPNFNIQILNPYRTMQRTKIWGPHHKITKKKGRKHNHPRGYNSTHDSRNKSNWGKWVSKFTTKFAPFGDESERAIGAVTNANLRESAIAPFNDGSKHGIDLPLEVGGPPASQLGGRVELGVEVEGGVKRGVLEGAEPWLADEHGASPSVLEGEPGEDVGEALVSQLGPVCPTSSELGLGGFLCLRFHFAMEDRAPVRVRCCSK